MTRIKADPGTSPHRLLLVLVGPTAVGKTEIAIQIAHFFRTEIISADSRQFYREMRIGTAVPTSAQLSAVPHHFIGHLSIHDEYNVYRFENDVLNLLRNLFQHHRLVVMTGGSGLYVNAVLKGIDDLPDPDPGLREQLKAKLGSEGIGALQKMLLELDPEYYKDVDKNNPKRLLRAIEVCLTTGSTFSSLRINQPRERNFRILQIGLDLPREQLYQRINERIDRMVDYGLVEEARSLYPFRHLNALNTVGYKELFKFFDGSITLDEALKDIKTHSRKYAKRQLTWFRRDPAIIWLPPDRFPDMIDLISRQLTTAEEN